MEKELSMIMSGFVQVKWEMTSMSGLLKDLEEYYYFSKQEELQRSACCVRKQLNLFIQEIGEGISDLDTYIINKKE